MLKSLREMERYTLSATDGEVGDQHATPLEATGITGAGEGRKPKADPMAKRTPGIPGPSACHEPFGT